MKEISRNLDLERVMELRDILFELKTNNEYNIKIILDEILRKNSGKEKKNIIIFHKKL